MDLRNIGHLGPITGSTLNIEEMCGLEASMLQRKLSENLNGKVQFWGKLFGVNQDYLVVVYINTTNADFPQKKYYFCTTSDYSLRSLPSNTSEFELKAESLSSQLTGDPSFFEGSGDEEIEEEDPAVEENSDDKQKNQLPEKFREVHRLSYIVKKIDHDCFLIPRGALLIDAKKKILFNKSFPGLTHQPQSTTTTATHNYMHFRRPESSQAISVLKQTGLVMSTDFLDCIDKDTPSEIWSVATNDSGTYSHVRNLYWEGYSFFCSLTSAGPDGDDEIGSYGGAYVGLGLPNKNIVFML